MRKIRGIAIGGTCYAFLVLGHGIMSENLFFDHVQPFAHDSITNLHPTSCRSNMGNSWEVKWRVRRPKEPLFL